MEKIKLSDHKAKLGNMPYHGHQRPEEDEAWVVRSLIADSAIPTSQVFGAANGGEVRKSFHGYAPPYAQVIASPQQFFITPMQIDTWNRDKMNITHSTFAPGPVPRTNLAPVTGSDATYSGLLECPLTTRIQKLVDGNYVAQVAATCANTSLIATPQECFRAAGTVAPGVNLTQTIVNNLTLPAGCLILVTKTGSASVVYNHAKSTVSCGAGSQGMHGQTASLVTVDVLVQQQNVTITLTGPVDVWFGVGFNASAMKDSPWAIIVDGTGAVTERQLADQSPGMVLAPSVTVVSHSVNKTVRTVVLQRPLLGHSSSYYTFSLTDTTIPFINAVGSGPQLAYHKAKTAAVLHLLPIDAPACVCAQQPAPFGQAKGSLQYMGGSTVGFGNVCAPQPASDLLAQRNPTCDIRTYVGQY